MTNQEDLIGNIFVDYKIIEKVEPYKYLLPKIVIGKLNQQIEINERIRLSYTTDYYIRCRNKSAYKQHHKRIKDKSKSNREDKE